jgi:glycogen(starch) synthase
LPWQPPVLLGVGRLVRDKGFDLALTAFASIRGHFPGLRMTIAGDGPAREELEGLAASLGIGQAVQFLGWVSPGEVGDLMGAATAVVVPSRWDEPFGLVAVEAGLMERPVVAARVGGLVEVVSEGLNGLTFPREDAGALAQALSALLSDRERAVELGRGGKRRATAEFSLRRVADDYESIYQRLRDQAPRLPVSRQAPDAGLSQSG